MTAHEWGWILFTTQPIWFSWYESLGIVVIAALLGFIPFYFGIRNERDKAP